jgi:hypothetical protein
LLVVVFIIKSVFTFFELFGAKKHKFERSEACNFSNLWGFGVLGFTLYKYSLVSVGAWHQPSQLHDEETKELERIMI